MGIKLLPKQKWLFDRIMLSEMGIPIEELMSLVGYKRRADMTTLLQPLVKQGVIYIHDDVARPVGSTEVCSHCGGLGIVAVR